MFCLVLIGLFGTYLLIDWLIRLPRISNYSNKYVFVTGCDSGFGRDLALRLDTMGFHVLACCYTQNGRQSLTELSSSRLFTLELDVAKTTTIQAALDTVKQKLPNDSSLWGVVNNAGIPGVAGRSEMLKKEVYMNICEVDLFGPMEVCRLFAPLLRKSKGRFVTMTSIMGRLSLDSSYGVAKSGLEAYCDVLRRDMHQFGVKVCILEPGFFKTGMMNVERMVKQTESLYNACDKDVQEAYGKDFVSKAREILTQSESYLSSKTHLVVDAYVDALTSRFPRCRYVVGNDAKFIFAPLSFLPEWVTDGLLRLVMKS